MYDGVQRVNRMKIISVTVVCSLLFLGTASFCGASQAKTLSGYIQLALTRNEDIQAAKSLLEAVTHKAEQMGVLPDPMLNFQYYIEPVETRTGPQNAAIGVSQKIPWFGKLSLQREKSKNNIVQAQKRYAAVQLRVVRQVKQAFIQLGYIGHSRKIVRENIELLRYLEGIVRAGYASGKSSYGDVLKLQIELAKTEDQLQSLTDLVGPYQTRLNSLLGNSLNDSFAIPVELPIVSLKLPEKEILERAKLRNPKLLESKEEINKAKTDLELAKRDFFPDFTLSLKTLLTGSAEFGNPPDSGEDPVIAGVSLNIPVFYSKRISAMEEKKAFVNAAVVANSQHGRTLVAEVEFVLFKYREARRQYELYDLDLLPKARQKMEVALEAFQGGQYSILELVDSEKLLLNFELAKSMALKNQAMQIAFLEEYSGSKLTSWDKTIVASIN